MKLRSVLAFTILLFALSACADISPTPLPPTTISIPTPVPGSTTLSELTPSTPIPSPSPAAIIPTLLPTNLSTPQLTTSVLATTVPPTTIPLITGSTITAPVTAAPLSIQQFDLLQIEEMYPGKRITFQWTAVGADEVCLVSGTSRRLTPWWGQLPLEGTLTVEVAGTLYRAPQFTLQAFTGEDICLVPEAPADSENR